MENRLSKQKVILGAIILLQVLMMLFVAMFCPIAMMPTRYLTLIGCGTIG